MASSVVPPLIAIVGRPNVGKSTLFNRLIGRRQAVVAEERGTTRDRVYGTTTWRGRSLRIVDSGGFEFDPKDLMSQDVQRQLRRAVAEADHLLFVCDEQQGPVPADQMTLDTLRKTGKPLTVVANKVDRHRSTPPECISLGVPDTFAISALHGLGIGDLLDHVVEQLPARATKVDPTAIAVAIIGRPNVGKSSLLNMLLREDRVIVSPIPGTTRDAIDTRLMVKGHPVLLIDTAGIKARRKVKDPVEWFSMARTMDAIDRSDVILFMLDGVQGVVTDDRRLLEKIVESGRGLVLLVNKWDAAKVVPREELIASVHGQLPWARFAPVVPISAKTGFQVASALHHAQQVVKAMRREWAEEELTALVKKIWLNNPPPRYRGRVLTVNHARWLGGRPAKIQVRVTPVAKLPGGYQSYLLRKISEDVRFSGVPLAITLV